ncbi:MAG: alpha-hydroxy acid oxidase [Nocardioidaceae bacterium]
MSRWIDELEGLAAQRLPEPVQRYIRQGAGAGVSAAEATEAWRQTRLLPHVLRDVSAVATGTTLLGTPVRAPIAIAPTTLLRHAHADGELEMARGSSAADTVLCVSSNGGTPFTDIASTGAAWWVQAYVLRDRGRTREMCQRAVAASARAVVLTVDTPMVGTKLDGADSIWQITPDHFLHANEDLRSVSHLGVEKAADLTGDDVAWIAELTGLPVVVKGVLRPDDAAAVIDAGAAAVWVSNHGGRQLDGAVATRRALPAVVESVAGRGEVYVDGGIRRGVDVLAALALGATAAFVGRPTMWALTVEGASGVGRLLDDLHNELVEAMMLCGAADLPSLTPDLVEPG